MTNGEPYTEEPHQAALKSEAAQCFQAAFDGVLTIICHDEKPFRQSGTPEPDASICTLRIDGHMTPPAVIIADNGHTDEAAPKHGHLTWRASRDVLQRIFLGDRQLSGAYIAGRLLISGDMAVMARLRPSEHVSS